MDYDPLKIYDARPKETNILTWSFIVSGALDIPITFTLLVSTLKCLKKKTTPDMKIGLGILIFDFITACSIFAIGIFAIVDGYYLPTHPILCDFNAIIYTGSMYLSAWFVGLMSLERGLLIIHNISLSDAVWVGIMIGECCYFIGFNLAKIAIGNMELMTLAIYCLGSLDTNIGFATQISYAVMMWLNIAFTLYAYIGIAVIQRRRAWREIRELNSDPKKTLTACNRIISKVMLLLFIYLLGNLVELINTTKELVTGVPRPPILDLVSTMLYNLCPIINSLLLLQFQEPVRTSFLQMYPWISRFVSKNLELKPNEMSS